MIYIYKEKVEAGKTILVKAESQEAVANLLNIADTYEFLGSVTDDEISALSTTSFGVITA